TSGWCGAIHMVDLLRLTAAGTLPRFCKWNHFGNSNSLRAVYVRRPGNGCKLEYREEDLFAHGKHSSSCDHWYYSNNGPSWNAANAYRRRIWSREHRQPGNAERCSDDTLVMEYHLDHAFHCCWRDVGPDGRESSSKSECE